jgi:hypothetical protein
MTRTGKIARLPKTLRDAVNTALRDGATAAAVIKLVSAAAANGTTNGDGSAIEIPNEQNITNWRDGGYQDWLKEQERLDDMRAKREFALRVVQENEGSKIHEAGLNLAASQIFELLQDFDVSTLKEQLADDPENYSKVVSALARISKEALGFEKYRQLVAEQKRKIEDALNTAKTKGGLTPDTLATIEQAAAML